MAIEFRVTIEKTLRDKLAGDVENATNAPVTITHLGNGQCVVTVQAFGDVVRNQAARAIEHTGCEHVAVQEG